MAITINHTGSGSNPSGTNTITITSSTGNLLVLQVSMNSGANSVTGVSDNINGAWLQAGTNGVVSSGAMSQVFFKQGASTGATTITLTVSSNTEYAYQWFDLGGAATSGALEGTTVLSNQTAAANPSGPSLVVTGKADFICAQIGTSTSVTAVNSSSGAPTGSWTGTFPDPSNTGSGFAYDNSTGSGTYSPSWTMASGAWGGVTAAFVAAGFGSPGYVELFRGTNTAGPSWAI